MIIIPLIIAAVGGIDILRFFAEYDKNDRSNEMLARGVILLGVAYVAFAFLNTGGGY